ncbi:phosphotransferase-like protein [Rhizorhabdus dicambivorans]|uniref:Shikimate kinase n=1 Tax=Rhizorhabdus dicambivorans TaxID=1850238 RepID=A0A2A4G0P5_9SPHN|nr:shikimate kinase [Rhizorhabdus dicambivorans]ATE63347.1 shikimate kinase [Rhizorhabdus dicambivorans]PCE43561.1 shikimate kinase [Rhizorhabdus dicambivorans]
MQLVFLYGQAAAGKLTVARELAAITGLPLFHNHLVVDAVMAVFPFGSDSFVTLRECFWLETIDAAAAEGRSLIFTFAPEPSVATDFPQRLIAMVGRRGGSVLTVALEIDPEEQRRRLVDEGRAAFGKLRSLDMFDALHGDFARCMAAMPAADLVIDTTATAPGEAARRIAARLSR